MRQTLHIFKKDVRHLRYEILAVLGLIAVFAYLAANSQPAVTQYSSAADRLNAVYQFILPLALWYLIAAVIHEEPLPGDQHFWLTRPYSRQSLVGAKVLFIVAWVNLPMVIADCVIIKAQGFQPSSYLPNIFCRQILLTIVWLLPLAALAAVTKNLRQFVLAALIIPVLVFISAFFQYGWFLSSYWGGVEWIANSAFIAVVGLAAVVILLCQYSRRRTTFARVFAVCTFALVLALPLLLPRSAIHKLQIALSKPAINQASIHISLAPTRRRTVDSYTGGNALPGTAEIDLPLEVTGLPEGMDLIADYLTLTIESVDGKRWQDKDRARLYQSSDGGFWMKIYIDLPVFEQLKNMPMTLRTEAYLTLLGNPRSTRVEAQAKSTAVPGFGLCSLFAAHQLGWNLICRSPFRSSSLFQKTAWVWNNDLYNASTNPAELPEGGSYSPYPAETGLSPLVTTHQVTVSSAMQAAIRAAIIVTEVPLGHFRRDLEFHGLRFDEHGVRVTYTPTSEETLAEGRITGSVLDEQQQPIGEAQVCTVVGFPSKSESQCFGRTDKTGQFLIEHLPMGTFGVVASKGEDGYADFDGASMQRVKLTPDAPLARVVLKLGPREGILIPSVKDNATGKPITDFSVLATVRGPSSGWQIGAGFSRWTTRTPIPAGRDVWLEVSAHGYKKQVYAEPLHWQPGERKTLSIELQPEEKHVTTTHQF